MKGKSITKLLLCAALLLALLLFGNSYRAYVDLVEKTENILISPTSSDTNPPSFIRYKIYSPYTNTSELRAHYVITASDNLKFEVKDFSESNHLKKLLTPTFIQNYINSQDNFVKQIPIDLFSPQKIVDTGFSPTIVLQEGQLNSLKKFQITFTAKPSLWTYFLGKPAKTLTYYVSSGHINLWTGYVDPNYSQDDDEANTFLNRILNKYASEFHSNIRKNYTQNCPVSYIAYNYNFKRPLFAQKTNDYDYVKFSCSLDDKDLPFTGEQITVEIYTQDIEEGKKAFRDALAQDGFAESDKLRVVYIHKPGKEPNATPSS